MGGTRCTYRKCTNTSANKKDYHFYHYPVKDPERLQQWILQAGRIDEFAGLAVAKLKNKAICQDHFSAECFMNHTKQNLTKRAIPSDPPKTATSGKREKSDPEQETSIIRVEQPHQEIEGDAIMELPYTIINGTLVGDESGAGTSLKLSSATTQDVAKDDTESKSLQKYVKELEVRHEDLVSRLEDVKKMLKDVVEDRREPLNTSGPNMNKRRLFEGIKKHVNPVVATLLRMELCGSADRAWLADEKELAIELHSQGRPIYKYFRDEWRLRLPAITEIERWKQQGEENNSGH